jgi:hypothetical protein
MIRVVTALHAQATYAYIQSCKYSSVLLALVLHLLLLSVKH